MRVFIAVPVPVEIRQKAALLGKELAGDGILPVAAGNMHLTLKFIGEVDERGLEEIKKRLEAVRFRKFHCEIKGVGVFPKEDFVRVVWAGAQSRHALEALAKDVIGALKGFGKDENFTAHLTIARVKRKVDFHAFLKTHEMESLGSFEVAEFHFIQSVLGGGGPEYSLIASYRAEDSDA
ncbi:MAG: RNA 2',3'-cyclic phosphodiesterase [Candidatus Micrarchaeota archaeon]